MIDNIKNKQLLQNISMTTKSKGTKQDNYTPSTDIPFKICV